jgi:hypothetical protein
MELDIQKYIELYKRDGVIVVENILTQDELRLCRDGLHQDLLNEGVDYNNLDAHNLDALKRVQTHPSGGMPFHYSDWRVRYCALNEKLYALTTTLWKETWAVSAPGFECPWAPFDPERAYCFLDSLNFRLPTHLLGKGARKDLLQRNLGPHIDVNPWDKWGGRKGATRWRPFQGFISLTDSAGGFECAPGFHLELDSFFARQPNNGNGVGFIALQGNQYQPIVRRIKPLVYPPGSLVLWDWRLPHATAVSHPGPDTREVVYTSFLPDTPVNRQYAADQLAAFHRGVFPPDFARDRSGPKKVPGWDPSILSTANPLQQRLLGITPW